MYRPLFKKCLNVKYHSCNKRLPPEKVCGLSVLNEGNCIELVLA